MSATAAISYNSLRDAGSEARQVARKFTAYADSLNNSVYNKLNNYSGDYTGNIASAKSKTNAKMLELRKKSQAYTNYANDLSELNNRCQSTDRAVKSAVSQLTATFKSANGIRNSNVENAINYFLTGLSNSTVAGRWLNNASDKYESIKSYIKQSIEDWWDYEGGKEFVKEVAAGILEIAIAVCMILEAGTLIAIIAGVIAIANGVVNIVNECRAYNETHNNEDPALGKRRSSENTIQDTIRRESDSSLLHNIATGIDVVNFVCTSITAVNSAGKLIKNCYKWATGNVSQLKELKSVKILSSKENWMQFFGKIWSNTKQGWTEIKTSIGEDGFSFCKKAALNFKSDFIYNLKDNFSSPQNVLNVVKNIVTDGIDITNKDVRMNILKDFILPGITVMNITALSVDSTGQMKFEFSNVVMDDIYSIGNKIYNKMYKKWPFKSDSLIDAALIEKLGSNCNVRIETPQIYVPNIVIPAVRVA